MMEEPPSIVQDLSLQLNDDTDDGNNTKMMENHSVNDPKNDNHHNNTNDDNNNMNNYTIIHEYNDNDDNDIDHNDDINNNIDINHHKVNIVTWFTFYSQREQREYYYEPISGITTWVVPQQLQLQEQEDNMNHNTDNTMMIHDDNNENDNTADTTTTTNRIINRIMFVMNHIYGLFMDIIHRLNIYCTKVIHTYYNIYTNDNKNDDDDDDTTTDTNTDYQKYDMKTKQMIDRIMNLMNQMLNVIIESINHMIVYSNNMIHISYNKLITLLNDATQTDTTDNYKDIGIDTTTTTPIRRLIHRIMVVSNHVYDILIESMNPMITSIQDVHSKHILPIITKRPIAIGLFICNIILFYIYFFMILNSTTTPTNNDNNHNLILVPKSPSPLSSSTLSIVPPTAIVLSIDNNTIPSSSSSIVDDNINNNVQPSLLYLENDNSNNNNNSDTAYNVDIQDEKIILVDTNQRIAENYDNDVDNINNVNMDVSVEGESLHISPVNDDNEDENDNMSSIVVPDIDTIIPIDEKLPTEAIHDVTSSSGTTKQQMLNDDLINDDDDPYESTHATTITTTTVNDIVATTSSTTDMKQQQQEIDKEQLVNPVVSDSDVDRLVQNDDIIEQQTAIQETSIDQNTGTINKYTSLDNTQNDDATSTSNNNNNNTTNTNTTIPILNQIDLIQKEVYTIVQRVGNQAIMAGYDIELEPNLTNYNRTAMLQPLIVNNSKNTTKE